MKDPYREAVARLFNAVESSVTPDQRRLAKSVAFAARYNNSDPLREINALVARRRRARRQQRWAIALCLIGSALLLAWGAFNAH